jgi:hypothetical protein
MKQPVRRCVWHWTAGGTRTGADAATRVVRAMKARTKPDGSPLSVGIHFVVSWDGIVTQSADLSTGTHHAGNMNDGSIGVELTWPGTEGQARALRVDGGHILPRRTAQGRLSEIFGARTIKIDELLRRFGLYELALSSVEAQDDYTKAALEAYARGVNSWLEEVNRGARGRGQRMGGKGRIHRGNDMRLTVDQRAIDIKEGNTVRRNHGPYGHRNRKQHFRACRAVVIDIKDL